MRGYGCTLAAQVTDLYANWILVECDSSVVGAVLGDRDVVDFSLAAASPGKDSESYLTQNLTKEYICDGTPARGIAGVDSAACETGSPYVDSLNQATLVFPYHNMGFQGSGVAGLAPWAVGVDLGSVEKPHLVLGFVSNNPVDVYARHPAFMSPTGDEPRIRYVTVGLDDLGRLTDDVDEIPAVTKTHGSRVLAVAMADVTWGQDPQLPDATAREARSGVARDAWAYVSLTGHLDFFNKISADGVDGIDVAFSTSTTNSNFWWCGSDGKCWPDDLVFSDDRDQCPNPDQVRGLDAEAQASVSAFLYDSVPFFKSAGNLGGANLSRCLGDLWTGVNSEIGAPGGSPAAVTVGAGSSQTMTAFEIFKSVGLNGQSSSGPTADGRVYPTLSVPAWQCGLASRVEESVTDRYGEMGATSGATPRVAGNAILFKHWYLTRHPEVANTPGRLIANLLNMADGGVPDGSTGGQAPAQGSGLGRMKMKLFERGHLGGNWLRGSTAVTFTDTDYVFAIDVGGGAPLPQDVRELRISLWWLEVNTDEGDEKAPVGAYLWVNDERAIAPTGDSRSPLIRFQFECRSAAYARPPAGEVLLVIHCTQMVAEQRYRRRSTRTVYAAWSWETEHSPDDFTPLCGELVPCFEPGSVDVGGHKYLEAPNVFVHTVSGSKDVVDAIAALERLGEAPRPEAGDEAAKPKGPAAGSWRATAGGK